MFQLISIFALVAIVRSTTGHDYFDSIAESTAGMIKNLPSQFNQILSLEEYQPSEDVVRILQQYKHAAKQCAVDEKKFDNSFQQHIQYCVVKSASTVNKRALANGLNKAINQVQLIDQGLKSNAILFPPSDDSTSPGEVGKTKQREKLKKVLDESNTFIQGLLSTTKSAMDSCVIDESEKLRSDVIDAIKRIRNC